MQLLNSLLLFGSCLVLITWLSPDKWQRWVMVLGTAVFLLIKAQVSLLILSLSTLSSYWVFQAGLRPGLAATLILVQNLGIFIFYKTGLGSSLMPLENRLIPLGLSYYTFRQIHYAIEQYKGQLAPHRFADYVAYLFFLPTILIGPIHRFPNFLRSSFRRRWDSGLFAEGLERILYGYAKIVIISNFLLTGKFSTVIASLEQQNDWLYQYLKLLNFTLNTYFQFAGYSDVAIGLALLLGYRVMENFNYPFLAPNINEFWNRWHISLSSWCRDYVYTPVASITRKPVLGIIMTMLVIGLWHDISLRYIAWGVYHGLGVAAWQLYSRTKWAARLQERLPAYSYFAILLTFHFVLLSFVFIQENSWMDMWEVVSILMGLGKG